MYELYRGPIYDPSRRYFFPTVTITALGDIQFNKPIIGNMEKPHFYVVQCFYNKETDRIGFRFCNNPYIEGGHTIFARKTYRSVISAKCFLKSIGKLPKHKEIYRIVYDQDNDLNEVVYY